MNHPLDINNLRALESDPLYEHLNDDTDTFTVGIYQARWSAQTFTSPDTHLIQKVCLKGFHTGPIEQVATIGIQATNDAGEPAGPDLTFTTFSTHLFKRNAPAEWQCINIPETELTGGVMYAIVVRVPGADSAQRLNLRKTLDSGYPNGRAWESTDGGVTWGGNARWCYQFEEWGEPPAPPPPPGPPSKWACLNLVATCLADGYSFLATTNKPVHLWLRLTDHPTRKHLSSELVRGETKMTDLKFCFTVYDDIEQEEAGDTLEHTFIVRGWLKWQFCEPWGDTLQENNTWIPLPDYDPPTVAVKNGLCTVYGKAILWQWLRTPNYGGLWPLINPNGDHLYFYHHSPFTVCNPTTGFLAYQLWTFKTPNQWLLEPTIDRGSHWGPWGTNTFATAEHGGSDIGKGPGILDLTDYWIMLRTLGGLDADPEGWYVNPPWLALEQLDNNQEQEITNNYMTLSYLPNLPDPQDFKAFLGKRYFYLIGTIDEVPSPSTSNIFTYHFPPKPYRNQLVATPTSSDRAYSDQGLYNIFYPPMDYYCQRLAACLSKENAYGEDEYPDYIYLEVREAPNLNECGPLIALATIPTYRVPVDPLFRWEWDTVRGVSLKKGQPYAFVVKSSEPLGTAYWGMAARLLTDECIMSPAFGDTFIAVNPCQKADKKVGVLFLCASEAMPVPKGEYYI